MDKIYVFILTVCFIVTSQSLPFKLNTSESKNASLRDIKISDLHPPDHLEALKMERDGHINKNYRKEILLGRDVEEEEQDEAILRRVFRNADINNNDLLSQNELEKWIAAKIKEHFLKAVKDNFWIFSTLDKDRNGRVSWDEYHVNFMMEQGFDEKFAKNHPKDHKKLNRKVLEKILLDKAAWSEAANSDPDALNIDEFLTFRHPEHSHVSLLNMVNDIINNLDSDGDELLTEEEFMSMPMEETSKMSEKEWKRQRLKEFREVIDINHDGKVNRQELLMYNDPENPVLAKREARELIALADLDKDGKLSIEEILSKKDVFMGSKMIDTAKSFHDEF
ncbi:45 kDa calcium-binding protein-like [Centruroides sculpturatus]|uniref:45 kDa calcium-binding protein-like n=1 Tax=Centruroides sculpturatus TaxID=218467 RepID=UPI000C6E47F3|nr:45 kDa calcium-binding protein-like [Centruroides sculpturatus]